MLSVAQVIEGALDEGFTTVRDAGGLEPAWAHGGRGRPAPRASHPAVRARPSRRRAATLTTGSATRRNMPASPFPGLVAGHVIADGIDEVRRAAREQLRRGATQIKLMASGGII